MPVRTRSRSSTTDAGDYVSIAIAYAESAVEDRRGKRYGKWIRLAAKRFLSDLKRAQRKRPPFLWSPQQANRACRFIERLPHVEGVWEEPTIRLTPAQVFFVCQLFGFRTPAGGRRFTVALYAIARKNAKSTLAAAITLYVFCEEPEPGPQMVSAATTGDQARIVWNVAKRMVEKTSALREHYGVEPFANTIVRYGTGGTFRPINAKASTQDGLNPSAVVLDELHAHKTHDLLNVLTSAAGARSSPLFLYTTTEGYETPGPWPEQREFAKKVLEGTIEADHYLAIYYAIDDEDDEFDESAWVKANPLLESNPALLAAIQKEAIEARSMPGKLAEFRIKRLNRPSASAKSFVNLSKWKRCSGPVVLEELRGSPCWGGLDLATTTDMAAWWLLWLKDGHWYAWGRYWVPSEAVRQRTERRSVPYASWVAEGLITQTEGDTADYDVIERDVLADYERFAPRAIAYDPWNASALVTRLQAAGVPSATPDYAVGLQQFRQGPQSYQPAMTAFEQAYLSGRFSHGGHKVLTWNFANLVPRTDVNGNRAPDRKRSADKIDGACAVLMAFGLASQGDDSAMFDQFLRNVVSA